MPFLSEPYAGDQLGDIEFLKLAPKPVMAPLSRMAFMAACEAVAVRPAP